MRRLIVLRRVSQSVFLILFIYILWSTTYPLKGPLPPGTIFKIDPFIVILTSISERIIIPGISFSAAMILMTLIIGRFFCGWICPLGTALDITAVLCGSKRPPDKPANERTTKPKFYILASAVIASFLGSQLAWIFDPLAIMARFVSLNLIPATTAIIDSIFFILIRYLNLYGPVQSLYRALKTTILGVRVDHFTHAGIIFVFFLCICAMTLLAKRFWCRALCPLGALYALTAKFSLLGRVVEKCVDCEKCQSACRMGAIREDASYEKSECILCMDCVYDCPRHITRFRWPGRSGLKETGKREGVEGGGISRGEFIFLIFSSILALGFKPDGKKKKEDLGIIRPPAALKEKDFTNRCIRCGNCMKVCITNGLQPALFESGPEGIWTPRLVPEVGYCEYLCTLCGNTCPTGAIPPISVEEKRLIKLGVAEVDRSICIPWAEGKECIVCQEHCPISEKAIKLQEGDARTNMVSKPYVDEDLCVGCGICQNKCPVRPIRAIRVSPRNSDRR